jgi:tetratricopeptide (TPR) repeat protein
MALARTGALAEAQAELERLERLAADPALVAWKLKNTNPAADIVRIAVLSLKAELAWADTGPASAVPWLREATRSEDGLAADEPHLWLAPTRHALGAALLAAGQPADAAQVYREDLRHYPGNGWSLGGLALALERTGQSAAARQAASQAAAAFAQAERRPAGSRF